jgi:lysosomal Pro-X carboxypeptidase
MLAHLAIFSAASPFPGCKGGTLEGCPSTVNCTVHYLEQQIDHFNWASPLGDASHTTFQQRFFINQQWWDREGHGPIFFYFGNEDNVELYVNHTGLMWESAAEFGAMLVFGEHRYYGMSMPYAPNTPGCMSFLTMEQAMADMAYLIDHLREQWGAAESAFVGFGGSYGGMLGSWFRVHYPNAIDGVIAASAPIWSFSGLHPPYDYNAFNQGVTFDASAAGGSTDACKTNLKAAWPRILGAGQTPDGRQLLTEAFRTCKPVRPRDATSDDPYSILQWAEGPWANMAMGNYPFASSYLMHGDSLLPPWPVRVACSHLAKVDAEKDGDRALFEAVRAAVAVQYNNTGDQRCFDITGQLELEARRPRKMTSPPRRMVQGALPRPVQPRLTLTEQGPADRCVGDWGYQWCTEMTQPFTQGTDQDMFYCPNGTFYPKQNCSDWSAGACPEWSVTPRPEWARVALGGKRIAGSSNLVFSNGLQDPWHGGGVLTNLSDSIFAIILPNGAHHIDLMFSDPADVDYPDIGWAREFERGQMRRWVQEHAQKRMTKRAARQEL